MSAEYNALVQHAQEHHPHTLLDIYGATNAAEFFAVATEVFFEKPQLMRERHTRLYEVLRDFYRQDTAARMDAIENETTSEDPT
jgi:Mlc titration factor MtfA (ptsG expression regulator)